METEAHMLIPVPEPFGGALIIGRIQLGRARIQLSYVSMARILLRKARKYFQLETHQP